MLVFLSGTLCHAPLLAAVLGRGVPARPARLPGHEVLWAAGAALAALRPAPGAEAEGLVADLAADDRARIAHFLGDAREDEARVIVAGAAVAARVFWPDAALAPSGPAFSLDGWAARFGAAETATAEDVMALMGQCPGRALALRRAQMRVRGAARARAAQEPAAARLRRVAAPGDVAVTRRAEPYARFFAVEEYDLSFRRFAGDMSEAVNRAVFVSGDAATVLPYDPRRDRVLLIEQFRAGPFARGDRNPWLLEPIAGRIDPGETPEETARREAVEEAGLVLGALHLVGRYYPTPGAKSEFLHSYVGLADLPDGAARLGGIAAEAEDIRGHVVDFAALAGLAATGEAANGPLLLSLLWLERHRDRLRAEAGA